MSFAGALTQGAEEEPVAITRINGQDAETFLNEVNLKYSSFQDPDSQWNSQFPSYANPGALLSIAASLVYMGDSLTLGYENGEERTEDSLAIVQSGADFDGVETGEDFYDRFCDPDAANATTTQPGAGSAVGSELERDAVVPVEFPAPVVQDSGANETFGYFLSGGAAYDDVAVLSVSSFAGTGVGGVEYLTNFQEVVAAFLERSRRAGKRRLVVDLSANGGGFVVAGFELFAQLFPDIERFGAENIRLSGSLADIARVFEGVLSPDFQPQTLDELRGVQALAQSPIASNLVPGAVFTPRDEPFASVGDVVAPVELRGDRFTAYLHTPLDMPAADFNLTGTGDRADPPPAVFRPEDVVLLTDGTCGSTCTIFSYLMILQAGVKTVTMGGRPRAGPMQAIAGVEGAQVFNMVDIAAAASAALGLAAGVGAEEELGARDELEALAAGYAVRRAADPAFAGSVNGKNAFAMADARTPLQFLYEPANCRFFATREMLAAPEAAWRRAVDATWSDPARFCVAGSRKPLDDDDEVRTLDPLFDAAGDTTETTTDNADQDGGAPDDRNVVSVAGDGDAPDEEDATSGAVGTLTRIAGSRRMAAGAAFATAMWLWIR